MPLARTFSLTSKPRLTGLLPVNVRQARHTFRVPTQAHLFLHTGDFPPVFLSQQMALQGAPGVTRGSSLSSALCSGGRGDLGGLPPSCPASVALCLFRLSLFLSWLKATFPAWSQSQNS